MMRCAWLRAFAAGIFAGATSAVCALPETNGVTQGRGMHAGSVLEYHILM